MSQLDDVRHLDTASSLIKRYSRTGNAFISLNGARGIDLYSRLPNDRLKRWFINAFQKNPRAILGLTRSHLLIHTIKIFKKNGLTALVVPASMLAMFLAMLPEPVVWFVLIASFLYLLVTTAKPIITFKRKEKIQYGKSNNTYR